jgi:hypothetical protein
MNAVHYSDPPGISLTDALKRRARSGSPRRLAIDVVGGVLVADSALFWRPPGWPVLLGAALLFVAFGTWGFADRALSEARNTPRPRVAVTSPLLFLRFVAVTVGAISALTLLFGGAGVAMGVWIE